MKLISNLNNTYDLYTDSNNYLATVSATKVNIREGIVEIFPSYYIHTSADLTIYKNLYKQPVTDKLVSEQKLITLFYNNDNVHAGIQHTLEEFPGFMRGLNASKNLPDGEVVAVYPGILKGENEECPSAYRYCLKDKKNVLDGHRTQQQANLINHVDEPLAGYRFKEGDSKKNQIDEKPNFIMNVQFQEQIIRVPNTDLFLPIMYCEAIKCIPAGTPIVTDYGDEYDFEGKKKKEIDLEQKHFARMILDDLKKELSENKNPVPSLEKIIAKYHKKVKAKLHPNCVKLSLPLLIAHMLCGIGAEKNPNNFKLLQILVNEIISICNNDESYNSLYSLVALFIKNNNLTYLDEFFLMIISYCFDPGKNELYFDMRSDYFTTALTVCDIDEAGCQLFFRSLTTAIKKIKLEYQAKQNKQTKPQLDSSSQSIFKAKKRKLENPKNPEAKKQKASNETDRPDILEKNKLR